MRVAALLLAFSTGLPALGGEAPPADEPPERSSVYHDSVLSTRRPLFRAADDPGARSTAQSVVFGFYTSSQVNLDAAGLNIIGDAANEPSIAINPANPDHLIIGWRQFDTIASDFRQAGYAFSLDGGATWSTPGVLTPVSFRSDPVLDFDSSGNAYYQSVFISPVIENEVAKSLDGGATWGAPVAAFGGDKNWMVIDTSGGIGDGHLYGTWQAFFGCCGLDSFVRSTDGTTSFETPVEPLFNPGIGTMAVGPDGTVYLAGIDESGDFCLDCFVVSRSADAQDATAAPTFEASQVDLGGSMVVGPGSGPNPGGALGQANIAVDRSSGPSRGNVYLLASVQTATDPMDVHFARSTDGGDLWTTPIRVNDDAPGNGAWQWFGALAVAPNGRIDVVWNDTRAGTQPELSQLYYAYSHDQGQSWSANVPISPVFDSHLGWPQQNKLGDYTTLVSDATGARVAYAATFNGEQDVYFVRVFPDCNGNAISDETDIDLGSSADCNGDRIPDDCQLLGPCPTAGAVSDLRVSPEPGGNLLLEWDPSCLAGGDDYAIYEGSFDDFTGHVPLLCTTSGALGQSITPGAGNRYYLVVPRSPFAEGSYGFTSEGGARLPGRTVCAPLNPGVCPAP